MDGVSGAASLIAIVTIALQSTKIICGFVTGIHHGPPLLNELLLELQNLEDILKRITDLSNNPIQTNFTDFRRLESLSRRCVTDLQNVEGKLESLRGGRNIEKAWNKLKAYLHIRFLEEIRERLFHYVQAFTAELGVATIDDLGRMNIAMHKYFASSASQAALISNEIQAKHGQHVSSVSKLAQQNSKNHLAVMEVMRDHHEELSHVHHSIGSLRQISASYNARSEHAASSAQNESRQISQDIASISTRLDGLSSVSKDQYDALQRMLEQIVNNQKAEVANHSEGTTEDKDETEEPQPSSAQLVESIHRLWSLVSITDAIYFSEDAQSIIEDLGKLLSSAWECQAKKTAKISKQRQVHELYDRDNASELHSRRDLKRVRGLLTASQSVHVVKKGLPKATKSPQPLVTLRSRCESIYLQAGTLTVYSRFQGCRRSQKRPKDLSQPIAYGRGCDNVLEVSTSTITFIPTDHVVRAKLSATFHQEITTKGFSSIHPILSFCSMIPEDSIIFNIIADRDMENLVSMFEKKLASVTDCDPNGRSLLNYACYYNSVDVCKFLLQHGADPNSVERGRGIYGESLRDHNVPFPSFLIPSIVTSRTPPNHLSANTHSSTPMLLQATDLFPVLVDVECIPQEYEEMLQCSKLLLDAGSDPTMETTFDLPSGMILTDSYLTRVFYWDTLPMEGIRQVMNCDQFWFDVETTDEDGRKYLLLAALAIRRDHWELWQEVLQHCGKDVDQVYAVLRVGGWLFPGDQGYNGEDGSDACYPYWRHGRPYPFEADEEVEEVEDRSDSRTGSDNDDDDSEGGADLDFDT